MNIDILCNDGSPLNVTLKSIYGDDGRIGIGGAELALFTMIEIWKKSGYNVVLYNDPINPDPDVLEQRPIRSFNHKDKRDILITFRSPNPRSILAEGYKVWWSCDQYTVGDFRAFSRFMNKTVCISPFHKKYFEDVYNILDTVVIDLPIRTWDFDAPVNKIKNKFIFTSVPDRGLQNLWRMWKSIRNEVPDASLTITSDYRLWGSGQNNEIHRSRWLIHDGVNFLGAVPRRTMINELLSSEVMLYPSNYDELFCIAVAEAQISKVIPITSAFGALKTTNLGKIVDVDSNDMRNDHAFIDTAIRLLNDRKQLVIDAENVYSNSLKRFHPDVIKKEWDDRVFNV